MPTYVYDRNRDMMVNKETGEPMLTEAERARPLQTPTTYPDDAGYHSPIDGRWIEGRRARRYDLESNGCVEAGDIKPRGVLKNERFAKKHNLTHLLEQ